MFFPHHDLSFDGNWFLRILVPPIVFEAALGIDKKSFHRHVVPILLYAIAGTLLATMLTAYVVHRGSILLGSWCTTVPYVEALTFGALISSIDPIAVLSVLSNMGMTDTDTIYVLIFGESLLNDGVAIVLFETLGKHMYGQTTLLGSVFHD
jgi:NhaP-type Na+/H+ or K+/H+ antiporter